MRPFLATMLLASACASHAETACPAPSATPEVQTDATGTRTVRTGSVTVTASPDGRLEVVGADGKRVFVERDGTVRSAERDVVVVRADGSREVVHTTTIVRETTREDDAVADASREAVSAPVAGAPEAEPAKATICHVPPGNPANQHTLSVGASAVSAHLGHGDYEGPCDPARAGTKSKGNGKGRNK